MTIISIYTSNNRAPRYMKQKLTEEKGEIGNPKIRVKDFNTTLAVMDRAPRQKINKKRKT